MASSDSQYEELIRLKQDFLDYQNEAKEYEAALEKELEEKDIKLIETFEVLKAVQENFDALKKKYQQNEVEIVRLQMELDKTRRELKRYEEQKVELEQMNDQWERSARVLEYSKQSLEERLYQAEENVIIYKEELEELNQTKEIEVQRLKDECKELKHELLLIEISPPPVEKDRVRSPSSKVRNTLETVTNITISSSKPQSKNPSRSISRKPSVDETPLRQNVKVLVSFRPTSSGESWDNHVLHLDQSCVTVKEKNKEIKSFDFERVFLPETPQEMIFDEILESINKLPFGGKACIMAYGQTGSGKTYTMNSMISLSLQRLSLIISEDIEVSVQCIEVYNEQLKDLLSDEPLSKNWKEVLIKSEMKLAQNWKHEAWELIQKAISRRITKFTECNERSSRSHAILCFNFNGPSGLGKIQFVDLAGSERIGKSQVVGDTLKEALLINKSLSALQDVITALESRQKHIPYRNSMLTQILQPTLGGSESLVTMIMNCSPTTESLSETLCTLSLGSRVKAVDLGFFIRKNLANKEVERTLTLLEKERSEKNGLMRTVDKLQRDIESYQIALKDKENKLGNLNLKLKQRNFGGEKKKLEVILYGNNKKSRYDNREIRVGSFSPLYSPPHSPVGLKGSRIPIPSFINLKMNKK